MPVSIECPGCGTNYDIPSKAIGRKVSCKCGRTFIAESPAEDPRAIFEQLEDVAPEPPESALAKTTPHLDTSVETDVVEDLPRDPRWKQTPSVENASYPNLTLYLRIATLVFRIQLLLGLIASGAIGAVTVAMVINERDFSTVWSGVFATILVLTATVVLYVISMAGIEFVRLMIDLRHDTQQTAEHLAALRIELATHAR